MSNGTILTLGLVGAGALAGVLGSRPGSAAILAEPAIVRATLRDARRMADTMAAVARAEGWRVLVQVGGPGEPAFTVTWVDAFGRTHATPVRVEKRTKPAGPTARYALAEARGTRGEQGSRATLLELRAGIARAGSPSPTALATLEEKGWVFSDFDAEVIRLGADRAKLVARIAKKNRPEAEGGLLGTEYADFVEHLQQRLVELDAEIAARRTVVDRQEAARVAREEATGGPQVENAVQAAVAELGRRHALEHAEALVAAVKAAGGPATTRAWQRPGSGDTRVYFPMDQYLAVDSGGNLSEGYRKIHFLASGFYPNWRRAIQAGREAYHAGWQALYYRQQDERVALTAEVRAKFARKGSRQVQSPGEKERFSVRSPEAGYKLIAGSVYTQNHEKALRVTPTHRVAVLLPCAGTKPFSTAPSHAHGYVPALEGLDVDRYVVAEPLGIIPWAWEDTWPNNAYDFPPDQLKGRGRALLVQRIREWLEGPGTKYDQLVLALPGHHGRLVNEAAEGLGLPLHDASIHACRAPGDATEKRACGTRIHRATSGEYKRFLRREVEGVLAKQGGQGRTGTARRKAAAWGSAAREVVVKKDPLRKYDTGLCAEFATALHRVHGYPLAMWIETWTERGSEPEFDEEVEGGYGHVVAVHPSGLLLDARGLGTREQIESALGVVPMLDLPGKHFVFRKTTEDELDRMGGEGLDAVEVRVAERLVRAHPERYGPLVQPHNKRV